MAARVMIGGRWRSLVDAEALLRVFNHPGHADQKSHGRRGGGPTGAGIGKDRVAEIVTDSDNLLASRGDPVAITNSYHDRDMVGIAERQGFDGPPRVVSREEMNAAIAAGAIQIWRGTRPGLSNVDPAQVNETFRSGDYQPGKGFFGNGFYFTVSRGVGEAYRGADLQFDGDYNIVGFSGGAPGGLLRAGLDPKARVLDYAPGTKLKTGEGLVGSAQTLLRDPGRYAAAQGYDAVRLRGRTDGVSLDAESSPDQILVLNRSAVIVQEAGDDL